MKRQTFFIEVVFCRLKSVYERFGLPALFGFLPIKRRAFLECPCITLFGHENGERFLQTYSKRYAVASEIGTKRKKVTYKQKIKNLS
jgi:hypothetical protein